VSRHPIPDAGWVIVGPEMGAAAGDYVLGFTFKRTRGEAIARLLRVWERGWRTKWCNWKRRGYRAVRAEIRVKP
jgi:hypothetical protein